ncbi:MAG: T9SS type A sorting domain-containing protein [Bacteroidales bacterium]
MIISAYVSQSTPPFQLTGGTPAGGTYSGNGVSGGMFDPSAAGIGEHTITYTYTDPNFCTNTATALLTVTEFTDIKELAEKEEIFVYPNPNNGRFSLQINKEINGNLDLKVINAMGKIVYSKTGIDAGKGNLIELNLDYLPLGIYYLIADDSNTSLKQKILIR